MADIRACRLTTLDFAATFTVVGGRSRSHSHLAGIVELSRISPRFRIAMAMAGSYMPSGARLAGNCLGAACQLPAFVLNIEWGCSLRKPRTSLWQTKGINSVFSIPLAKGVTFPSKVVEASRDAENRGALDAGKRSRASVVGTAENTETKRRRGSVHEGEHEPQPGGRECILRGKKVPRQLTDRGRQ